MSLVTCLSAIYRHVLRCPGEPVKHLLLPSLLCSFMKLVQYALCACQCCSVSSHRLRTCMHGQLFLIGHCCFVYALTKFVWWPYPMGREACPRCVYYSDVYRQVHVCGQANTAPNYFLSSELWCTHQYAAIHFMFVTLHLQAAENKNHFYGGWNLAKLRNSRR